MRVSLPRPLIRKRIRTISPYKHATTTTLPHFHFFVVIINYFPVGTGGNKGERKVSLTKQQKKKKMEQISSTHNKR